MQVERPPPKGEGPGKRANAETMRPNDSSQLGRRVSEAEAVNLTGLSARTLFRARKAGRLRCALVGGRVLYRPMDLEAFLQEHEHGPGGAA